LLFHYTNGFRKARQCYVLHISILPVLLATNMDQMHQLPPPHRVSVSRVVIMHVAIKVHFEYLHLVHFKIFILQSKCLTTFTSDPIPVRNSAGIIPCPLSSCVLRSCIQYQRKAVCSLFSWRYNTFVYIFTAQ